MKKMLFNDGLMSPYFIAAFIDEKARIVRVASYKAVESVADEDVTDAWSFGKTVCRTPDGSKAIELASVQNIRLTATNGTIPKREWTDNCSLYILMNLQGQIQPPCNKMVDSYSRKENGAQFLNRLQMSAIGQIYVPFSTSTWDDIVLRLTVNKSFGYWCNLNLEEMQSTHEAFQELADSIFPKIVADKKQVTVSADGTARLKFNLTPARQGVTLYLKSNAGYISKREVKTDSQGCVEVNVLPLGLDAGDAFDVEVGFKWYSNIARTRIKVK